MSVWKGILRVPRFEVPQIWRRAAFLMEPAWASLVRILVVVALAVVALAVAGRILVVVALAVLWVAVECLGWAAKWKAVEVEGSAVALGVAAADQQG